MVAQTKKPERLYLADTNKSRLEEELDALENQGWKVVEAWIKYECFFANLVRKQ